MWKRTVCSNCQNYSSALKILLYRLSSLFSSDLFIIHMIWLWLRFTTTKLRCNHLVQTYATLQSLRYSIHSSQTFALLDEYTTLFLRLLLVHVPILVPVNRHAAFLAVAAYSVSYAQTQEALLRHYFRFWLVSLGITTLCCNLHLQLNGHNVLLQRVSTKTLIGYFLSLESR